MSAVSSNLRVPWGPWRALIASIVGYVVLPSILYLILSYGFSWIPAVHSFVNAPSTDLGASLLFSLLTAASVAVTLWYVLKRFDANLASLGFRRFNVWQTLLLVAGVLAAFILLSAAALWLAQIVIPHFNADQPQTNEFLQGDTPRMEWISFIGLVVIPPIVEETLFRGFLFPAFATRYGFWIGAIASSALFAVAHGQANVAVYTFVLGLLLCWLYRRTGSILPGMAIHMINNYLAYIALVHP